MEVLHGADAELRSEEHTSELQSPYDLVCRLLLEKKKKNKKKIPIQKKKIENINKHVSITSNLVDDYHPYNVRHFHYLATSVHTRHLYHHYYQPVYQLRMTTLSHGNKFINLNRIYTYFLKLHIHI